MNMTKRDIADIVLFWMAITFILAFLTSFISLGFYLGMTDEAETYTDRWTALVFQGLHCLVLLLLNYVIIFKRSVILDHVFPIAREKTVSVPDNLTSLTSYEFWIRLLGIFIFLTSATEFFSQLTMELASKQGVHFSSFWMVRSGQELLSALVALLVIWKAAWIADAFRKLGSPNKQIQPTGDPPSGPPAADL